MISYLFLNVNTIILFICFSSEMVANLEWVNTAPDSENNYTMECPFRLEGEPSNMGTATEPVSEHIPKAMLICRHNSHPFQKRTLILHQPVKVRKHTLNYTNII